MGGVSQQGLPMLWMSPSGELSLLPCRVEPDDGAPED